EALRGLRPLGPTCGAEVTWRKAHAPAGPGYFLVGDAAAVLDPASSHGVLKALMSGMMAAHLLGQVFRRCCPPTAAADAYHGWLWDWFEHDVQKLQQLYAFLNPVPKSV